MTIRYLNEERSSLSYLTPAAIITLLEMDLDTRVSTYEELKAILEEYGVTSCSRFRVDFLTCFIPAASVSPFEFGPIWWWGLNTFYFEHEINIFWRRGIVSSEQRRVGVSTYSLYLDYYNFALRSDPQTDYGKERELFDGYPVRMK
ncbi:MAG: hypothetical protein J0M33_13400 [Anaerolineae bacterium]|nr:hypothetical protein [Anaerolineae bacterium]